MFDAIVWGILRISQYPLDNFAFLQMDHSKNVRLKNKIEFPSALCITSSKIVN